MITKFRPEPKTLTPKSLDELVFSVDDKNIYTIENLLQRNFVWDYRCCETLWHDICECIRINTENMASGKNSYIGKNYTKAYLTIGNIEYSNIDECNSNSRLIKPLDDGTYKSAVDGSQRIRMCIIMSFAFMYVINKLEGREYIDLDVFKNTNGQYKLCEIGIDKLDEFYKYLEQPISVISRDIIPIDKIYRKFSKSNEERKYNDIFYLAVDFIEQDILGNGFDIATAFHVMLRNVYVYEEYIPYENKFERFRDRNQKGTPMSDEDMYPKFIINQFKSDEKNLVYKSFKRFKESADYAQSNGHFRPTKSKVDAVLFIMIEVLKIRLARQSIYKDSINLSKVFSSSFTLNNINYGIEKCFKEDIIFSSYEDAIDYFNECKMMADWLIDESFKRHDDIHKDTYHFRDFASSNLVWWYYIKPCYLAYGIKDYEYFKFVMKSLFVIYSFYVVHRFSDTNVQNTINLLESISSDLILISDTDNAKKVIREKVARYINNAGGCDELRSLINGSLKYNIKKGRTTMEQILATVEYYLCERYGLPTDAYYNMWVRRGKNKSYNLDHWFPENKFKDYENADEYHQLGNIILLEDTLNKSKQDKVETNSHNFAQSRFIQTQLLSNTNRGPILKNNELDDLTNNVKFLRFEETTVNNPELCDIQKRTRAYADLFVSFIRDFIEDNNV